jgi:hypothetical protein
MVAVKFHVDDLGYYPHIEGAKDNKVGKRDMQARLDFAPMSGLDSRPELGAHSVALDP